MGKSQSAVTATSPSLRRSKINWSKNLRSMIGTDRARSTINLSPRQPLRAIVKDLVVKDVPLTGKVADKILRDLKAMRRKRIYPGDIRARNYKAGLLVDFSIAITEPYFLFDLRGPKQAEMMKNGDLYM